MVSKAPHVLLEAAGRLPRGSVSVDLFGGYTPYHGDDSYRARLDPLVIDRHENRNTADDEDERGCCHDLKTGDGAERSAADAAAARNGVAPGPAEYKKAPAPVDACCSKRFVARTFTSAASFCFAAQCTNR